MHNVISMTEVKEKLSALKEGDLGLSKETAQFYRWFSSTLNPELLPIGFNLAFELACHDYATIAKGATVDGYGRAFPSIFIGYPGFPYAIVLSGVKAKRSEVQRHVLPEDFCKEVEGIQAEVETAIQNQQPS